MKPGQVACGYGYNCVLVGDENDEEMLQNKEFTIAFENLEGKIWEEQCDITSDTAEQETEITKMHSKHTVKVNSLYIFIFGFNLLLKIELPFSTYIRCASLRKDVALIGTTTNSFFTCLPAYNATMKLNIHRDKTIREVPVHVLGFRLLGQSN